MISLTCLLLSTVPAVKAQDADNSYFAKLKLLKDMEGKPSPSFEATTLSSSSVKGSQVFKNEKDEILNSQDAVKMLISGTHQAFRKFDKNGQEYYQLKPAVKVSSN